MPFRKALEYTTTAAFALAAGCGGGGGTSSAVLASAGPAVSVGVGITPASTPYTCQSGSSVDCTRLPLGDLRYSTTAAKAGSIYVCSAPNGGGPIVASAPWLNTAAGTFDLTKKYAVLGAVSWPGAFTATLANSGATRTVAGNGLQPAPYTTGTFPIQPTDPAAAYDRNPNAIASHAFSYTFPAVPVVNATPACVPAGGPIAVTLTGVAVYNAFDAAGYDGVAHEVQDGCHGHPDPSSTYHYHGLIQMCSADPGSATTNSSLIGYALDGFGIYGPWYNGKMLGTADLDACHGTASAVLWDGRLVTMYHYVSTYDFPYTIGCFRGTPVRAQ